MPKLIKAFFVMMFLTAISYGQSITDVSLWTSGAYAAPWVFYKGDKMTAEVRYGWDDKKTLGACIGKKFGPESFTLIPEACVYSGKSKGYGPEMYVQSETKHFSLTSYVQYAKLRNTSSFGYLWLESEVLLSKHFGVGPGGQILKDGSNRIDADFGPSTRISFKKAYITMMPLWKVTPQDRGKFTLVTGFGWVF